MLFLSEQEMWQSVTLEDVMDAIEDAYAIHKSGNYKMPDRFIAQRDKNMMLYMPCFLDSVIGTKMLSEFPDNPSLGIPYLNGLMILNDAKTGLPKAIMNGSALTAMQWVRSAVSHCAIWLQRMLPQLVWLAAVCRDYTSFSMPARCARSQIFICMTHTLRIFPALSNAYRRVWHRLEKRHPDSYLRGYP